MKVSNKIPFVLLRKGNDGFDECEIKVDKYYDCSEYELKDMKGNVIISYIENDNDKSFSINYFDGTNILMTVFSNDGQNSLLHYRYDEKQGVSRLKREIKSQNRILGAPKIIIADGSNIGILKEEINWGNESVSSLYSLEQGEIISPKFSELALIGYNNDVPVFFFMDTVKSETGELLTTLNGSINGKGTMYNGVYDDYFVREREVDLNSHPNFMQYNALKRAVQRDLNAEEEQKKQNSKNAYKVKEKFLNNISRI